MSVLALAFVLLQQSSSVELSLSSDTLTLGQPISATYTIRYDRGLNVVWPETAEPFEVRGIDTVSATDETGTALTVTYALTAFQLGEQELPAMRFLITGGGIVDSVVAPARGVTVVSVGLDESGDIRDIKPPLGIPRRWWPQVLLTVAALIAAAWLWHRRGRRTAGSDATIASTRPPHELALEALERLAQSDLLDRGKIKRYYIMLAAILRTYVTGRWSIDALDMTTDELMQKLGHADLAPDDRDVAGHILRQCDLVKFAKHRPGRAASRDTFELTRSLIASTAPLAPTEHEASEAA
ncbi:MAG: hypothetical protein ACE5FJ_03090 [Gemmatimonadales bacterium]